ncbi:MAG: MopE-related protein [Candidatus Zixiibacteriota bacterium]
MSQDVFDLSSMNNNGILGIDYGLAYDPIRVSSTLSLIEAEDNDNDGFTADVDCDDNDPYTYPGAAPNDDIDACMRDADEDDYGDIDATGDIMPGTDCDDSQPLAYPGAVETWYDGVDQNCDGLNDFDQDGDGYVHIDYPEEAGGSAPFTGDCNDENPDINPGAIEVWYDGVDQNCDGKDDFDQDEDGYAIDVDCDDENPEINPGAAETWYDGIDQNCDGLNDYDADFDGYVLEGFDSEAGGSAPGIGDCDDTNPEVNPATIWYFDADDDGWGIENDTLMRCEQPVHYVLLYPDNCPLVFNPDQADTTDGDGVGIACDDDDDDDGIDDTADYCQFYYDPTLPQRDVDADKVGDSCDNCIHTANGDQTDSDGDGRGDACDVCPGYDDFGDDSDGDGIPDACDCIAGANCGDANGDCSVNIGDAVYIINYIFKGQAAPQPECVGDVNDDQGLNIGDAVYLISYIFRGGPPPHSTCCSNWPFKTP